MALRKYLEIKPLFSEKRLLELDITASDGIFAGTASGYIDRAPFQRIANELAEFPRCVDDEIKLNLEPIFGGNACLTFHCYDGKGHLAVLVDLTGEPWIDGDSAADRVSFRLKFELSALREFAAQLKKLAIDKAEVARLNAGRKT